MQSGRYVTATREPRQGLNSPSKTMFKKPNSKFAFPLIVQKESRTSVFKSMKPLDFEKILRSKFGRYVGAGMCVFTVIFVHSLMM